MSFALRSRLRRIFWRIRHKRRFGAPSDTNREPQYRRYSIGAYTYGAPKIVDWHDGTNLKIGKFCSLAEGVTILLGGEHRPDWVTTFPFNQLFLEARSFAGTPRSKGEVVIGNDVWIASESMILSGVRIGDGAVIAARSLVTRDVPAYAVVAGQPATVKRFRFDEATVEKLLEIAWWDWSFDAIKDAWPLLLSGDVETFVDRYTR